MDDSKVQAKPEFLSMVPVIERLIWPLPVQSKDIVRKKMKQERKYSSDCTFPSDFLEPTQLCCSPMQQVEEHSNVDDPTEMFPLLEDNDSKIQSDGGFDSDSDTLSIDKFQQENGKHSASPSGIESNPTTVHTGDMFCRCLKCEKYPNKKNKLLKPKPICTICKKSFRSVRNVQEHTITVHGGKKHFCTICSSAFNEKYFKIHMKTQHSSATKEVHNCEKCDKSFMNKSSLQRHVMRHHNSSGKPLQVSVPCDICGKYVSSHSLSRHKKLKHSENNETFKCDHCNAQLKTQLCLTSHMILKHLPPTIKCKMCDSLFANSTKLKKHLLVEHSIGKKDKCVYVCEFCGEKFNCSNKKDYHVKTSHPKGDKKFKCRHCEKSFYVKHHLKQHSVSHSEVRQFNCELCDTSFKLKHHLQQHMSVHRVKGYPDYRKKQQDEAHTSSSDTDQDPEVIDDTPVSEVQDTMELGHFLEVDIKMPIIHQF